MSVQLLRRGVSISTTNEIAEYIKAEKCFKEEGK
jgi:hypothetical protein